MSNSKVLLLFDGLDECSSNTMIELVERQILELARNSKFTANQSGIILTSRIPVRSGMVE